MMYVTFLISCRAGKNSGVGGHNRSLIEIAHAIDQPYRIIVIGDFVPEPLKHDRNVNLVSEQRNSRATAEKIHRLIQETYLLHAYNYRAATVGMFMSMRMKVPLVVTKAGGMPWSKAVLPWQHMIVFSRQDYDRLSNHIFAPRKLALIPNRVSPQAESHFQKHDAFTQCGNGIIKILCIARFHEMNLYRFHAALQLGEAFRKSGLKAHVTIVGAVQNKTTLDSIVRLSANTETTLLTDPKFTKDASVCLGSADVVVASGRAVGEALQCGKLIFFPVKENSLPCLLSPETYNVAEANNFTARTPVGGTVDPDSAFVRFVASSREEKLALSSWGKRIFEERFSTNTGAKKTIDFYNMVSGPERGIATLFRNSWDGAKLLLRSLKI